VPDPVEAAPGQVVDAVVVRERVAEVAVPGGGEVFGLEAAAAFRQDAELPAAAR
jgi:hypothetical protein